MRRMTAWGRSRVGAGDPLVDYHAPISVDPAIARRANEKLSQYLAERAAYGRIDYEIQTGSLAGLTAPRWYAFRYSQHPPDAGNGSPHPGVDYLIGRLATADELHVPGSTTFGLRQGLPAVAIVVVGLLLLGTGNKR